MKVSGVPSTPPPSTDFLSYPHFMLAREKGWGEQKINMYRGELIVWDSSWRACVRPFTLSNINISETSWPIIIKFYQKHHWGGGLTALGFGLDRIRTLVSMATDSSHRVIMGKIL